MLFSYSQIFAITVQSILIYLLDICSQITYKQNSFDVETADWIYLISFIDNFFIGVIAKLVPSSPSDRCRFRMIPSLEFLVCPEMKESTSLFDRRAFHARRISALTSPFSRQ